MLCKPSVSSRTRTILVPSWNKCADEVFCPADEKSHEHTESNYRVLSGLGAVALQQPETPHYRLFQVLASAHYNTLQGDYVGGRAPGSRSAHTEGVQEIAWVEQLDLVQGPSC